jgi:hypothetical protein
MDTLILTVRRFLKNQKTSDFDVGKMLKVTPLVTCGQFGRYLS